MRHYFVEDAMWPAVIGVAVLGALQPAGGAVRPAPGVAEVPRGEGADGGRGMTIHRSSSSSFLATPKVSQSPLVTVGEGGEGGDRGKGRRWHRQHYGYREPYQFRADPYPYGWRPPTYYAPAPQYGWSPPPPRYNNPPRQPPSTVWIDP
jgi:hypothetical protein